MADIQALSHSSTNRKVFALVTQQDLRGRRVVDVGAGEGYFSRLLGDHVRNALGVAPPDVLSACDLYPEIFRYPGLRCDPIDSSGRLPYPDATFDVAVSLEVVEHVEDQFHFARELYRVVRPGGRAIISTPNLLNINSRLRYLRSGFWLLFDPVPLGVPDAVHTSGHIHPVTFYYLAYVFRRAGFARLAVHFDRRKRSAVALSLLTLPYVAIGRALLGARLRRKTPAVYQENRGLVAATNAWDMLTCRSVTLEAVK